jgi:lipopolysaccharide assembly protein A
MRFLVILLWIVLILAAMIFAYNNWEPVTFYLWNNRVLDTYLPVPIVAAFLTGLVPYFLVHRATRWSLNRKLATAERALSAARSPIVEAPVAKVNESTLGAPIAVAPGVS